jgi:hypothetical protein
VREVLVAAGTAAGILLLATAAFVTTTRLIARRRRRVFLKGLGAVVRIGTPCRVARGRALLPGTVALTPRGIVWDATPAVPGSPGSLTFEETRLLESDDALLSGRRFLRSKVVRVTAVSGEVHEFVVSPGHAWEWRQALSEWAAKKGKVG